MNRLNKNTSLKLEYNEILNDYKKKGIIEEISENDNPRQGEVHYLVIKLFVGKIEKRQKLV